MKLPRVYLSSSQCDTWERSKDAYRKRYYLNEEQYTSEEMHFGSEVHKLLEDPNSDIQVPRFDTREFKIWINIEGLNVLAYIDDFDSKDFRFRDTKTGHITSKGKAPWDKDKVAEHKQLPFYAMLLREKYHLKGEIICFLDWLETGWYYPTEEFDGEILTATTQKLRLTGKIETFERCITPVEMDNQKERLLRIAKEISLDFQNWKLENKVDAQQLTS